MNVIKVDFRKDKKKKDETFDKFIKKVEEYERQQKFKTAFLMTSFVFLIILVASIPFVVDEIITHF